VINVGINKEFLQGDEMRFINKAFVVKDFTGDEKSVTAEELRDLTAIYRDNKEIKLTQEKDIYRRYAKYLFFSSSFQKMLAFSAQQGYHWCPLEAWLEPCPKECRKERKLLVLLRDWLFGYNRTGLEPLKIWNEIVNKFGFTVKEMKGEDLVIYWDKEKS
jgi:hypothetical protein